MLRKEIAALRREITQIRQPGPSSMQTDNHLKAIDPIQGQTILSHRGRHSRTNAKSGFTVYHDGKHRNLNTGAYYIIKVFADDEIISVGDKAFQWAVPEDVDLLQLEVVEAFITTTGATCIVDLHNVTQNVPLLSTKITITGGQLHSHASTPLPVVITANAEVDFRDQIRIDVDSAGGMGLGVILGFL